MTTLVPNLAVSLAAGLARTFPDHWFMIRFSQDHAAISTRLRALSLFWIRVMWVLTVLSEMNNSAAISWLVRPLAMLRAIWSSRSESCLPASAVARSRAGQAA